MVKIEIKNVKKQYGEKVVFEIQDLKIQENEKIGIVGVNGSGKTTLFRMIMGEETYEEGSISYSGKIAYIPQLIEIEYTNNTLSGGEKTKQVIQEKMMEKADILLADEPSNNLDLDSIQALKKRLKAYQGTVLIISHDRDLLDTICTSILEINEGKVKKYKGNYTAYKQQKEQEERTKKREYDAYQQEKNRLEKAIHATKNTAKNIKKAPKRMGNSEARLHKREAQEKAEKIQGKSKALQTRWEKLKEKEKPKEEQKVIMKMPNQLVRSKYMIQGEKVTIQFKSRTLLKEANFHLITNSKTALIGNNGCGKTSLVKKIISQKEDTIKINEQVKIGYFSQNLDILETDKTILENVLKDSIQDERTVRNILANLLIKGKEVEKKVAILSGGECVKVAIAKLLVSDANLLILDEPTNFLDIEAIEGLEKLLKEYQGTVLIITHDRKMIDAIATHIWLLEKEQLLEFEGNYEKYCNYEKRKANNKGNNKDKNEELKREMRLAMVTSKLAITKDEREKEQLEKEYQELIKKHKEDKEN